MTIAILGCGVSGLSAARELRRNGLDVKLFDKSRGVGGRMSTRYAGAWEFDHGAQYFTAQDRAFKDRAFKAEVEAAVRAGAAAPWPAKGIYLAVDDVSQDTGRARYAGQPRMNSLPKFWAKDLDIELGRPVRKVMKTDGWALRFENGSTESGFDGVICTLPPTQAKEIFPENIAFPQAATAAEMHACFALMIGLAQPIEFGWDTLRVKNLPIDWIAVNSAKPGRPKTVGTLVIHSEAKWSDDHVDADRGWIENVMLKCASALIGLPLEDSPHIALHRWLYASSKSSPNVDCLSLDGIVLAGDWCLGGRVQGAWLSGRAAARVFLK